MAADLTRGKRVGDVLVKELWPERGYCRTEITVTVEDDIAVGACLNSSGDWIDGSGSLGGNTKYILIDETVYDKANGDHTLVVLKRGPATIAKNALSFDGTAIAADYTAAAAALEALGIQVVDSVA